MDKNRLRKNWRKRESRTNIEKEKDLKIYV